MVNPLSPIIPIGEWRPDMLPFSMAGCTVARNCLSAGEDYKPFPSFGYVSDALGATCVGLFACRDATTNSVHVFAGTKTKLYKLSGTTWEDVTRASGGDYTIGDDGWWSFAIYGDRVIAVNGSDAPQSYVIGSSTDFAALGGSPPVARGVTVINNFVVLYGLVDNISRVKWSALDDPTDWTPSAATQSDFNDILGEGGSVQSIVGSQNVGIVIMEKEIWRMDYVGPDTIFNFTKIEDKRGTPAPRSVVGDGAFVYYLGEQGYYAFDGSKSISIGDEKVDDYFYGRVDENYVYSRVVGVSDPANKTVAWAYPNGNDSSDGTTTHLLAYNWQDNRWTEIASSMTLVAPSLTAGFTLEQVAALYPVLEDVPFSLDSNVWKGGKYVLGGIDTSGRFGYYDGTNMDAIVETSETQLNTGGLAEVQAMLVVTDSASVQAEVGYRMKLSDSISYTAAGTPSTATGEINFRNVSRYHRARLTISGTWTRIKGVQIRVRKQGHR